MEMTELKKLKISLEVRGFHAINWHEMKKEYDLRQDRLKKKFWGPLKVDPQKYYLITIVDFRVYRVDNYLVLRTGNWMDWRDNIKHHFEFPLDSQTALGIEKILFSERHINIEQRISKKVLENIIGLDLSQYKNKYTSYWVTEGGERLPNLEFDLIFQTQRRSFWGKKKHTVFDTFRNKHQKG